MRNREKEKNKLILEKVDGRFLTRAQKKYGTRMGINKVSFYKDNETVRDQFKGKTFLLEEIRYLDDIRKKGLYLVLIGKEYLFMRGEKVTDCFLQLPESQFIIFGRVLKISTFKR